MSTKFLDVLRDMLYRWGAVVHVTHDDESYVDGVVICVPRTLRHVSEPLIDVVISEAFSHVPIYIVERAEFHERETREAPALRSR